MVSALRNLPSASGGTCAIVVESLKNGSLPNFLLDGQASVLEDVMEIEPSLQGPISAN